MLEKLLAQAQRCDIETSTIGITNHLPMALIALSRLGADDDRLAEYFRFYSKKTQPLGEPSLRSEFNWAVNLGNKGSFPDYLNFYLGEIHKMGPEAVIHAHLDTLIKGVSAAAFHALIRLSYGVLHENPTEVAFGLAYMSAHYVLVPAPVACQNSPVEILNDALHEFENQAFIGNTISERMLAVSEHPDFLKINKIPKELSLQRISELVSDLYLASNDFTVLHGVTSCHAMRTVLPYIKDRSAALECYWSGILVAALSVRNLKLTKNGPLEVRPLDQLDINHVISSDDDHLIKLVFSCIEEYKEYQGLGHLKILNLKVPAKVSPGKK